MDLLDYNLIKTHSARIYKFFRYHAALLERINVIHKLEGSYAQFLLYDYSKKEYEHLNVDIAEAINNPAVSKHILFESLKSIAANASTMVEYRQDILALAMRVNMKIEVDGSFDDYLLYSNETRLAGVSEIYNIKPIKIQLADGEEADGVTIDYNKLLSERRIVTFEHYCLTHILRTHRDLN